MTDYFIHGGEFTISDKPIRHVDATMKLMSVLSNNKKYEDYVNTDVDSKEAIKMADMLDRLLARGEARGIVMGEARGEARGRLSAAQNLAKSQNWSLEKAMEAIGLSPAEQRELRAML